MSFNEIIFLFITNYYLFLAIYIQVYTSIHLLLAAEFIWATLYILVLFLSVSFNNIILMSLTFFFLVLSAIELGFGIVLTLIQKLITRSLSLDSGSRNSKFENFRLSKNFTNIENYNNVFKNNIF